MKEGNTYFISIYGSSVWRRTTYLEMHPKTEIAHEKYFFRGLVGIYIVLKDELNTRILTSFEKKVFDELEQTFGYNLKNIPTAKRITEMIKQEVNNRSKSI